MVHQDDSPKKHDRDITVSVVSGRSPEPKMLTFAQQTKVAEAARKAGEAFDYPPDQTFYLVRQIDEVVLEDERTLISYHIQDGETLVLSARVAGV